MPLTAAIKNANLSNQLVMNEFPKTTEIKKEFSDSDREQLTALLAKVRPAMRSPLKLEIEDAEEDENSELLFKLLEKINKIVALQEKGNQETLKPEDFKASFSPTSEKWAAETKQRVLNDLQVIILEKQLTEIDRGLAATVSFRQLDNQQLSSYCLKIVDKPDTNEDYKKYNSISREFRMQAEVFDVQHDIVKVPEPYLCIENKGLHLIVMEALDADPLYVYTGDVVEGRTFTAQQLPDDFDVDEFFDALEDYIKTLHRQNIHHRDLHDGNIMIDRKTKRPVVIDFGRTKRVMSNESPYDETIIETTGAQKNHYPKDLDKVKEYRDKLTKIKKNNTLKEAL